MKQNKNVSAYVTVANCEQLDTITVTEAGKLLNKTKEEMKRFVEERAYRK